jgi:hypothetical protein
MPPDSSHHCIECHLTKVFYKMRFASTGVHSWEARRTGVRVREFGNSGKGNRKVVKGKRLKVIVK